MFISDWRIFSINISQWIDLISRARETTGDYFSEPTSLLENKDGIRTIEMILVSTIWGQYGEENNQAGIFEAEGIKSLIPRRLARSPLYTYSKSAKRKLCVCA